MDMFIYVFEDESLNCLDCGWKITGGDKAHLSYARGNPDGQEYEVYCAGCHDYHEKLREDGVLC